MINVVCCDRGKGVWLWRFFFHVFDVSPGGWQCPRGASQARRPLMRHLHWLWSDKTAPLSFTCPRRWCYDSDGGMDLVNNTGIQCYCIEACRNIYKVDKNSEQYAQTNNAYLSFCGWINWITFSLAQPQHNNWVSCSVFPSNLKSDLLCFTRQT